MMLPTSSGLEPEVPVKELKESRKHCNLLTLLVDCSCSPVSEQQSGCYASVAPFAHSGSRLILFLAEAFRSCGTI